MTPPLPPRTEAVAIPDHELIACVGRGSYGEVWLAKSVMGTYRAIKIIRRQTFDHDRPFDREFQGIQRYEPISRTHPGLVAILHIGRNLEAGYFYYVMEVADDALTGQAIQPEKYVPQTLREVIRQGAIPLAVSLPWSVSLTAALGHLHQHGLIHRDIKPANIIFVNGSPKIADLGLVAPIGEAGTYVGTAGYLPPEGPGSPSADLFSLGKVLYEIGMNKTVDQFPELPTAVREVPDAAPLMRLNEIILQACDPNPTRRFQSAGEMQDALQELCPAFDPASRRSDIRVPRPERLPTQGLRVAIVFAADHAPDLQLARLLAQQAESAGFEVLVHEPVILSVAWARQLEQQIQRAEAVIVLLSPLAVQNEMLAYALELVHQAALEETSGPRVLPVLVQWATELPRKFAFALGDCARYLWENSADDEKVGDAVVAALNALRPDVSSPPKAAEIKKA